MAVTVEIHVEAQIRGVWTALATPLPRKTLALTGAIDTLGGTLSSGVEAKIWDNTSTAVTAPSFISILVTGAAADVEIIGGSGISHVRLADGVPLVLGSGLTGDSTGHFGGSTGVQITTLRLKNVGADALTWKAIVAQ